MKMECNYIVILNNNDNFFYCVEIFVIFLGVGGDNFFTVLKSSLYFGGGDNFFMYSIYDNECWR